jgi:hypothetical protein
MDLNGRALRLRGIAVVTETVLSLAQRLVIVSGENALRSNPVADRGA